MAAGKFTWYNEAMRYFLKGRIDLESQTIKVYPIRDSYSPSTGSHSALAQITAFQATASNTIVNAITLATSSVTGSGGDTVKWSGANISGFSSDGSTIPSFKYIVLVAQSASSGGGIDNLLIGFMNLDTTTASSSAGNSTQVNITWSSSGIGKLRSNP